MLDPRRTSSLLAMLTAFWLLAAAAGIGAITLEYEAEAGLFEGGAKAVFMEPASGGACAGYMHLEGAGVIIPNVLGGEGGEKSMTIRFAVDAHSVKKVLYINGDTTVITFPNTGGYRAFRDTIVKVRLQSKQGNIIAFRQDGHPHGLNIDKIAIDYGTDILSMTKGTLVSAPDPARGVSPHLLMAPLSNPFQFTKNGDAKFLALPALP